MVSLQQTLPVFPDMSPFCTFDSIALHVALNGTTLNEILLGPVISFWPI